MAFRGKIYVIWGWDGTTETGTVQIYTPEKNTWNTGASMPTPRTDLVAAVAISNGDKIFAVGRGSFGTSGPDNEVLAYEK